uniref:Uncharacterized protein n=1 Tax=Rhizophora mucronata TaxID=61149 RepID=A0A2P2NTU0_RHIMU
MRSLSFKQSGQTPTKTSFRWKKQQELSCLYPSIFMVYAHLRTT